jgi:hypothetical protein
MGYIRNIMESVGFRDTSRLHVSDFTRKRKVGFVTLLCLILNMIKKSSQLEIDEFLEKFGADNTICSSYTKQLFPPRLFNRS